MDEGSTFHVNARLSLAVLLDGSLLTYSCLFCRAINIFLYLPVYVLCLESSVCNKTSNDVKCTV